MLFQYFARHDPAILLNALQDAVAEHRDDLVRDLCTRYGPRRMAAALSSCAPEVRDDALSRLAAGQCYALGRRLRSATAQAPAPGPEPRSPAPARPSLQGLLTWTPPH